MHPLNVWILPRRARSRDDFLDAHVLDSSLEVMAVDRVAIAKQESRRFVERKRLDNLLSCPLRCRMSGDVEMHDTSPIMAEDDKREEYSKRRCRCREEIDGDDLSDVILQERTPSRRGRLASADHVLLDC